MLGKIRGKRETEGDNTVMDIRNICLLGHGGSGKTSLVESMLYITGVTDRLGKPADGNTVCDYDPEEIKRQISISMSIEPVQYQGVKINVLDTPGNFDFVGEMQSGVRAAECGRDGVRLQGRAERGRRALLEISQGAEEALHDLHLQGGRGERQLLHHAGGSAGQVRQLPGAGGGPIWDENKRTVGIIDVLNKKAYTISNDKKPKRVEIPIPANKLSVVEELYGQLMEAVAETTEENMEKYFAGEPFTKEEIHEGLKVGMREGSVAPVLCGIATHGPWHGDAAPDHRGPGALPPGDARGGGGE